MEKDLFEFIESRRSIRNFVYKEIKDDEIKQILNVGKWAPSGNNTQPWKVCVVIHPTVKHMLAEISKYGGIIDESYANLVIFLDLERGYDRVKDIQAIGAFIENILLAIHAKGLGGVWIGEILKSKEKVNEIFKLDESKFELMGLIAFGEVDDAILEKKKKDRKRRDIEEFTDWF